MPTIITRGAISAKAYGFGVSGGYSVSKSLRFRSSASAYLNRTFGTPTSATTWTLSWWAKLGAVQTNGGSFFGSYTSSASNFAVRYNTPGAYGGTGCNIEIYNNGSVMDLMTAGIFRDPSAWYHFCITFDSTQATASNRLKFYINGVQATFATFTTYPNQNTSVVWNTNGTTCLIGALNNPLTSYYDGYMAEVNFIDGQALAASSFGAYDTNGVWQPIKYSGSFGTNGFYLNFGNTTSTTTLGYDTSGNSNNWTTNNISLTAGSTYDSMTDVPTLTSATAANYAVLNPIAGATTDSLTNVNLNVSGTSTTAANFVSTMAIPLTGKWYWEVTYNGTTGTLRDCLGMVQTPNNGSTMPDQYNDGSWVFIYTALGYLRNYNQNLVATYSTITSGQTIGISFDSATGKVWLNINGTYANSGNPTAGTGQVLTINTGVNWFPTLGDYGNNANSSANFGQQPFTYTPPTGFKALNTYNLPTPTIANGAQYMAATLYTGNGTNAPNALVILNSNNNVAGTTFQPDFTWIKSRSLVSDHILQDSVRGTSVFLQSDTTGADQATGGGDVSSFNSNGFTISYNNARDNQAAATYVAWQWQAGKGVTSTNTSGTITSTVSANTTAGFSIVGYTGPGANATVGHGLGVAPSLVIVKNRTVITNWPVYHVSTGPGSYTYLNTTAAAAVDATMWNNIAPTSTVFSLGVNGQSSNIGNPYVAYCWAAVPGYSAFGSYTGNGSTDGPFIYLGFRPRWWLVKRTDTVESWNILDSSRDPYNQSGLNLYPNLTNAESSNDLADLVSNGVKLRNTWTGANTSGGTYIYAAFAENPFNTARAR